MNRLTNGELFNIVFQNCKIDKGSLSKNETIILLNFIELVSKNSKPQKVQKNLNNLYFDNKYPCFVCHDASDPVLKVSDNNTIKKGYFLIKKEFTEKIVHYFALNIEHNRKEYTNELIFYLENYIEVN